MKLRTQNPSKCNLRYALIAFLIGWLASGCFYGLPKAYENDTPSADEGEVFHG